MAEWGGAAGGGPPMTLEQLLSMVENMPMEESEREALRESLARQYEASQRLAAAAAAGASTLASGPPQAHDLVLTALAVTVAFILLFLGYRIYKSQRETSENSATKRTQSDETNKKRR
ncbi:uncharacterized protein LOC126234644 [Schistocerca nitens]|uniref:uncharacterized protein LOC126234644 n=1 Tax=Schistocerca nitens TaxID=7011 RepID=UPI002117309A|nr:uncharacterized protein LOC126234644 [Schistocerca nitens]XP_049799333.1 uncharacterized protein LOC126234644 [Schistocerca nitens]